MDTYLPPPPRITPRNNVAAKQVKIPSRVISYNCIALFRKTITACVPMHKIVWSVVASLRIAPFRTADNNTPFKLHRQIVLSPLTRRRRGAVYTIPKCLRQFMHSSILDGHACPLRPDARAGRLGWSVSCQCVPRPHAASMTEDNEYAVDTRSGDAPAAATDGAL